MRPPRPAPPAIPGKCGSQIALQSRVGYNSSMNRAQVWTIGALAGCILAGCGQPTGWVIKPVPVDERLKETVVAADKGWGVSDKVVLVDVDGPLTNRRRGGLFSVGDNPVSLFVEKLDKAEADPRVRAVVLRINSPGGGVTASDIMHRRLVRFRQKRKVPVVALFEDIGASGAYYLACAADLIVAHPTSVTGSIGVLVQTVSFAGTMKMIGVDAKAVTSGPMKDMASPFKPLDKKDLAVLQGIVDDFYARFLKVVDAGRPKLDMKKIRPLADGRVYTAQQALANGLIDGVGYMDDAIALAKKLGKAPRVKVVIYHRPLGYRANVYSEARPAAALQVNLLNVSADELAKLAQPRFLYLWTGHTAGK